MPEYNENMVGNDCSKLGMRKYLQKRVGGLHPSYFALVMATGIVSIACHSFGLDELARTLFLLNIVAYCALWGMYAARAVFFWPQFAADWVSHKRGFGFFTVVAATNVLGSQFFLLESNQSMATVLWWAGLGLWVATTYTIFVLLAVQAKKPSLEDGINGGWLVAVVATQSVCVLGSLLKPPFPGGSDFMLMFLLSFWLFGGMLYIWLISLIFYRYMFFRFEPSDLIPPYWINMGSVAISTLAGANFIIAVKGSSLESLVPFLKGFTALYWATATWWIPMLLILGVWRHGVRKFQFSYDPLYWGLVFPLGMYAVCTYKMNLIFGIAPLLVIAHIFLVAAIIAWFLTFMSMLKRPLYAVMLMLRARHFDLARMNSAPVTIATFNEGERHGKK
jgi:tellurite resistance protein TehA-like permease